MGSAIVMRSQWSSKRKGTRARGCSGLATAAARSLFKLMAYKDEYEVARLYSDGGFHKRLHDQFEGNFRIQYHLAPPFLAARDPATGEWRKRAFGAWIMGVFKLLARLRRLRGTRFDVFGYTRERRIERALIARYEALLCDLLTTLSSANHALAVEIASLPDRIAASAISRCAISSRLKHARLSFSPYGAGCRPPLRRRSTRSPGGPVPRAPNSVNWRLRTRSRVMFSSTRFRKHVDQWRDLLPGQWGVTPETQRLLLHSRDNDRERDRRGGVGRAELNYIAAVSEAGNRADLRKGD